MHLQKLTKEPKEKRIIWNINFKISETFIDHGL